MGHIRVDAIILGRNDDYSPNWLENLIDVISFNNRLFLNSKIDYRTIFVEWNAVEGKPLASTILKNQFGDKVKCIVIPNEVHSQICTSDICVMINYGFNCGARNSDADWILLTCGDILFGEEVSEFIKKGILNPRRVYVAKLSNVDTSTLDLKQVTCNHLKSAVIYNPSFFGNNGDFVLIAKETFWKCTGYDEYFTDQRGALDSQFLFNLYLRGHSLSVIGDVYHIDHKFSYMNTQVHPRIGVIRQADRIRVPYENEKNWGLSLFPEEVIDGIIYKKPLLQGFQNPNGGTFSKAYFFNKEQLYLLIKFILRDVKSNPFNVLRILSHTMLYTFKRKMPALLPHGLKEAIKRTLGQKLLARLTAFVSRDEKNKGVEI